MAESKKNWVKDRSLADPRGLLAELHKRFTKDLQLINELPVGVMVIRGLKTTEIDRTEFCVIVKDDKFNRVVLLSIQGNLINVYVGDSHRYEVKAHWDNERLRSRIFLDGELTTVREITQKVLGEVAFEALGTRRRFRGA